MEGSIGRSEHWQKSNIDTTDGKYASAGRTVPITEKNNPNNTSYQYQYYNLLTDGRIARQ